MNKDTLIKRLTEMPGLIAVTETAVLDWQSEVRRLESNVQDLADKLQVGGMIDGKNAELRAAQLREGTQSARIPLEAAERQLALEKIVLHHLHNELASLRAIARILTGSDIR